jgi:hypothetical protein
MPGGSPQRHHRCVHILHCAIRHRQHGQAKLLEIVCDNNLLPIVHNHQIRS